MRIRIAAIGVSHWHALNDAAYLRQLAQMADVEIVGLQDSQQYVVEHHANEIGGAPASTDFRVMLRRTKPDFVLALGRHDQMAQTAHCLLDNGIPFLMEKPMGLNAAEVEGVAERAAATNGFAAVPMPLRYSPFMIKARQMMDEGRFGTLSHMYVRINRFSSARYVAWDSAWMLDPAISAGGSLRNLGMHGLDLFSVLTGEPTDVSGAQLSFRTHLERVEDYASVLLRSESGVLGTIEVGNVYPRQTRDIATEGPTRDDLLDGADGEIKICGRDALLMAKDGVLRVVAANSEEDLPGVPPTNPAFDVIRDALAHWERGLPPPVGVEDCLRAVRLIDEAYRIATR